MKNKNSQKKILILTLVLLAVVTLLLVIYFISAKDTNSDDQSIVEQDDAQTTSTSPTAQDNFTDGTDREPGNSIREDAGRGTVVDGSGSIDSTPDQTNWNSSQSGDVTVYSPSTNSTLKSGDNLSGESNTSTVSFRLIDNVSGVIAQGELQVVNGKFSGTFNFQTNATEGRLDVFSRRTDGVEYNNVEIPVRFN